MTTESSGAGRAQEQRVHELRTWPSFFQAILDRRKTFEIRRNDRDFAVGDMLVLQEWNPTEDFYTMRSLRAEITYVMYGGRFGIDPEFCVLGFTSFEEVNDDE